MAGGRWLGIAFIALLWACVVSGAESRPAFDARRVKELAGKLGDKDPDVREKASRELVELGIGRRDEVLGALPADDPDPEVSLRLGKIRKEIDWDAPLRALLHGDAKDAKRRALYMSLFDRPIRYLPGDPTSCCGPYPPESLPAFRMLRLAKLAGDRKEEGRALVRHFLRHADPLLRTGAIQCLELDGVANCRDEATLSLLKGMAANDPDEHIRKSAAAVLKSLQQMDKDLRAEEIRLKEMAANDPDAHVRQGAAAALESLQQMDKDLRAPETKK